MQSFNWWKMNYRKSFKILIAPTIILLVLLANSGYKRRRNANHNCLADPPNCGNFDGIELLPVEYVKPTKNAIFFLEDHVHNFISPRVLCSVESAAVTNPTRSVFLLTSSPKIYHTPALSAVLSKNPNIHFGYFDPSKLFANTPLTQWYINQRWKESQWPTYHFSDAIRWLMLWSYGGIYMDTDVILMRKLLDSSFVARESNVSLGAGAVGLPARHVLLTKCVNDIANNYDPQVWGNIGPILLTKALLQICGNETLTKPSKLCPDVTVLGQKSFYPIHWTGWRQYYEEGNREDLFNDKDIYGLHVWNALSKYEVVDLLKKTPYTVAAKNFCPSVVKAVRNKM